MQIISSFDVLEIRDGAICKETAWIPLCWKGQVYACLLSRRYGVACQAHGGDDRSSCGPSFLSALTLHVQDTFQVHELFRMTPKTRSQLHLQGIPKTRRRQSTQRMKKQLRDLLVNGATLECRNRRPTSGTRLPDASTSPLMSQGCYSSVAEWLLVSI